MIEKNYNSYLQMDLSRFIGQWVAILDSTIISNGKELKKVYKEAKELSKGRKPLFVHVPENDFVLY